MVKTGYSEEELVDQRQVDFYTSGTMAFDSATILQGSTVNSNTTSFVLAL